MTERYTQIRGTQIKDDTVPESKLLVYNSPTGGYILSWDDSEQKLKWIPTFNGVTEVPSGDINGSNDTFTLLYEPADGSLHVYVNGLFQEEGSGNDFTVSGQTLTFVVPPVAGDIVICAYVAQDGAIGTHSHANKAQLDLVTDGDHDVRTDNPHNVTVAQLDLASGTTASDVDNAVSKAHDQNKDQYLDQGGSNQVAVADVKDAVDKKHSHSNKAELDLILDEDDYTKVDGTRAFTGTVGGITPTAGSHLTTKDYVDGLVQGLEYKESVLDMVGSLPGSPSNGQRYILTTDKKIYEYQDGWTSETPNEGWATWVEDEDALYVHNGSDWVQFGSTLTHNNLSGLQGGNGSDEYYHLNNSDYSELTAWLDDVVLGPTGKLTLPELQAYRSTVDTKTANYTITSSDFGKTIVMNSASDLTVYLPSVDSTDVGCIIEIVNLNTGRVTVDAADSDTIADSGAGDTIYSDGDGASITLRLVSSTHWQIITAYGLWITTD